tara:strand:- start:425 stop:1009 length:585 start_codon:yes stop_codon:yes gene_type:complete
MHSKLLNKINVLNMKRFIAALTISRIVMGPLIFFTIIFEFFLASLCIIVLSGISDFFDGFLARKYSLTTLQGKILDPIADKILITFSLIGISLYLQSLFTGCLCAFIIAREIWVSGLRDYNSATGNLNATEVTFLAKFKTTFQILTICLYLVGLFLNESLILFLSDWVLFIAALITIKTGLDYSNKTNIFGNKK